MFIISDSMKRKRTDFGILDIDIQGTGKEWGGAAENFQWRHHGH